MRYKRTIASLVIGCAVMLFSCQKQSEKLNVSERIAYCATQAEKTLTSIPNDSLIPRNVDSGKKEWRYVKFDDWTSGFWPGLLWYLYEATGDEKWKGEADRFSRLLEPLSKQAAWDHDLGFQVFNSYGHGYRLTHDSIYKQVVLRTADTLASLYNPKVGTILSWPRMVKDKGWPHNTIIDNMMNLELLFWASKNGPNKNLYNIAVQHARTTMENQFHDDIAYHVVVYDTITGKKLKGITHQGLSDESMWARGQAWAIYGYTMVYRETKEPEFLDFAVRLTEQYLRRLPDDYIPYWDFDDAPKGPKDASAAAITASALLELSRYVDEEKGNKYNEIAELTLTALGSPMYESREINSAFLLHSTGHMPNGSEVDASIIYADYYYLEALLRLKNQRAQVASR